MRWEADSAMTRREGLKRAAALGIVVGGVGSSRDREAFAATPKPKRGGTLRVGLPGGPAATDNLDPHLEGVAGFAQAYRQIVYSKLTDMRPNGSFVIQLAESMTPNKDATVWTIKLKKGVAFHDGERAHRRRRDLHVQADSRPGEQAERGPRQHRHDRPERNQEDQQVRDDREVDAAVVRPSRRGRPALLSASSRRCDGAVDGTERQRHGRVQAHWSGHPASTTATSPTATTSRPASRTSMA